MGRSFPGDYMPYFVDLLFTNPGFIMFSFLFMFFSTVVLFVHTFSSVPPVWQTVFVVSLELCLLNQICPRPPCPRHRKARPRWKRERKWRRRKLHYHLVQRCLRRPCDSSPRVGYQRPLCLDGVTRPSNAVKRHRRWKRRNLFAKVRWISRRRERAIKRRNAENVSFLASCSNGRFVLPGIIDSSLLNSACTKMLNPSNLQSMLKSFRGMDHRSHAQKTLDRLNALRAFECNHFPSKADVLATPCVWDTGASNGLTPF